jgi:hypothetical protein
MNSGDSSAGVLLLETLGIAVLAMFFFAMLVDYRGLLTAFVRYITPSPDSFPEWLKGIPPWRGLAAADEERPLGIGFTLTRLMAGLFFVCTLIGTVSSLIHMIFVLI